MKVLLIGMDGCHKEVFERGWTPFISSVLESHRHLEIENDLLSRGWLEVSLGEHAKLTSALYDKPKANGSLDWSTEFSVSDILRLNVEVRSLWEKLNEMGVSVGVVNVPTTFPAPRVNGFFVSGGGGGAPVTESAREDLCYPKDILPILQQNDYIVDDRLYQLVVKKNLDTPEKILKRMSYLNDRRTHSFLELNRRFDVDFGFIVYKTSSVITETLVNAERRRRSNPSNAPDEKMIDAARAYYSDFDRQVKKLIDANPGVEVLFVSDHGTTQRSHTVNPNVLLQEHGLQCVENKRALVKRVVAGIKASVPFWAKYYLKKFSPKKLQGVGAIDFDPQHTSAFCKTTGDWCHGIYVNDKRRFGGPVLDKEFSAVQDAIVEIVNSHPATRSNGILAEATTTGTEERSNHFPDVQLSMPNGYLTFDKGSEYISEYPVPECKSALASIMRGDILYMKSHSPLATMGKQASTRFRDEDLRGDLTVVHRIVLDMFKE